MDDRRSETNRSECLALSIINFPLSILHPRLFRMPFRRLFVGVRDAQDGRFVEMFADDLQADRHAVAVKAAGQRERRQAGQIDRDRVDIRQIHLQRVLDLLADLERRRRRGRRDDRHRSV